MFLQESAGEDLECFGIHREREPECAYDPGAGDDPNDLREVTCWRGQAVQFAPGSQSVRRDPARRGLHSRPDYAHALSPDQAKSTEVFANGCPRDDRRRRISTASA